MTKTTNESIEPPEVPPERLKPFKSVPWTVEYVESKGLTALAIPNERVVLVHAALKGHDVEREVLEHERGHGTGANAVGLMSGFGHDLRDYLLPMRQLRVYRVLLAERGPMYLLAWLLAGLKFLSPYFYVSGRLIANNSWIAAWMAHGVAFVGVALLLGQTWLLLAHGFVFLVSASAYGNRPGGEADQIQDVAKAFNAEAPK